MIALLAFASTAGCSTFTVQDDWSAKDDKRMMAVYASVAADAITTPRLGDRRGVKEGGQIASRVLGPKPDEGETLVYMAALSFGYRWLARRLPEKWRRVIQYGAIATHVAGTKETCDKGLC